MDLESSRDDERHVEPFLPPLSGAPLNFLPGANRKPKFCKWNDKVAKKVTSVYSESIVQLETEPTNSSDQKY